MYVLVSWCKYLWADVLTCELMYVLMSWCTCELMYVLVSWCMYLWADVLVSWCTYLWADVCTYELMYVLMSWCMYLWADVLPTRQYSANVFIVTTTTITVLILFSITGCRHAVPLYDGAVYRDQSSVAYHRQWHLCVGVWTRVKLALTVLLLEQKCSGTWPQKPATGSILVHIRAACFLNILFSIINHPFWKLG